MHMRDLESLVSRIASRDASRSEATLQADIRSLLLAAPLNLNEHGVEEVNLETPAGERRRIDIEAGFAVIEVKRDLRSGNVRADAAEQLAGYVKDRSDNLGQRYVGILTDGIEWQLYRLDSASSLEAVGEPLLLDRAAHALDDLLIWIEGVFATGQQVVPTPVEIERRLGADSPAHLLQFADLMALYEAHGTQPSVVVKRELWAKLLTTALGTNFRDDDALFVEHTLLVATAEVIAHAVVGYEPTLLAPATLLSGGLFDEALIAGVVESDFFDWVIEIPGGEEFVRSLARRVARFDWRAVEHDVMKVLYESVIGRRERYSLGEYYTPDWMAERMIQEVVTDPLNQRVLDPGCGSGTFLFHAVRHFLAASEEAGLSNADAIEGVTNSVLGLDLHPLAVTFARITYLLAIGMERIKGERAGFRVPVYLGDSLQWGQEQTLLNAGGLTVRTGEGAQLFASELNFPDALIEDAGGFDKLVMELADKAANRSRHSPVPALTQTFRRFPMSDDQQAAVTDTFRIMCELHDEERDHIWGYYVRNLARPRWLTNEANRVDVVIGNPPWLTHNAIAADLRVAFREACEERNLWGGGRSTRNYDLCALFVVRSIELYLRPGGSFAFVMPFATLSRRQFAGFRGADYPASAEPVSVEFTPPWDLSEVRPHAFPVPCCVVLGKRPATFDPSPLPSETVKWTGTLPDRNVRWEVAEPHLTTSSDAIAVTPDEYASPYAERFESGAKLTPQVLVIVEPAPAGPLGVPAGLRNVRSLPSTREPWRDVPPLEGAVEAEFVRPLQMGSTIVPFRALEPLSAIVPWDSTVRGLLSATDDALDRYPRLAQWWRRASALWDEHGTPENYDLTGRVDFQSKLSRQLPVAQQRVVYSKSGSRLTAARLAGPAIASETLYWATAASVDEARYLTAVLNSQSATDLVAPYQSQGQFGTRHFDLYVWYLPIPEYSATSPEHVELANLAARAEEVALGVDLPAGTGFAVARRRVREALDADGVAQEIETGVRRLLGVMTA